MTNKVQNPVEEVPQSVDINKKKRKTRTWTILGIIGLFVVIGGGALGGYMIHLSDTSPEFCSTCHLMEPNVTSYLTSNNLDNIHNQANVECKECHDYKLDAEIKSGINYVIGNYTVGTDGELLPIKYGDELCLQCHISYSHIAEETADLTRNPHKNHQGELACNTCHISHGEQIDYCSTCHENGGQEMVGADN